MTKIDQELNRYTALDARLVDAARHIKVLSALAWPPHLYDEFMAGWERGQPQLPKVNYPTTDLSAVRGALLAIVRDCDVTHPVGRYISQTAASYVIAARMLETVGKPTFRAMSEVLYGKPSDRLGKMSHLSLAEDFIKITGDFAGDIDAGADAEQIPPEVVAEELRRRAAAFFVGHQLDVVVDHNLTAKAAAGSERVRIRGRTSFTASEIEQLLEHEVFVHSATMLNGRGQPHLKSLGLGAPRTTGTQEGLATFAEMITATMDLSRLRRIALRIKAIQLALDGGDFIAVFRFFLASGQSPKESFQSAARIFRGGDVRGQHVFTKDVVYLTGLFSVHTFMRKAIEMRKIDYPQWLFIGRVALGDVISLEPFITSGYIAKAQYRPRWVANREGLAAYLSYAVFSNKLNLNEVRLVDFIDSPILDDLEGLDDDALDTDAIASGDV